MSLSLLSFLFFLGIPTVSEAIFVDDVNEGFDDVSIIHEGTQFNQGDGVIDMTAGGLAAQTAMFTSRIFDAGEPVSWETMQWQTTRPTHKNLVDNGGIDNGYAEGHVDMTNNRLLLHLDEVNWNGDPDEVLDSSGNLNHGVAQGNVNTSLDGKLGNAGLFDGDGDYLQIEDSDSLDLVNLFTLSAWIQTNVPNTGIIEKGPYNVVTDGAYTMALDAAGHPFCRISTQGQTFTATAATVVSDGQWHHIACTYDADAGLLQIYVDGTIDGLWPTNFFILPTLDPIRIGTYLQPLHDFQGYIDEVAIWSEAFTAEEIFDVYTRGALTLSVQVRSCNDANCDGEEFVGPDNDANLVYTEFASTSLRSPVFDLDVANNTFFQYQARFETDDNTLSPFLTSMQVVEAALPNTAPSTTITQIRNLALGSGHVEMALLFEDEDADEGRMQMLYKVEDGCANVVGTVTGTLLGDFVNNVDGDAYQLNGIVTEDVAALDVIWDTREDLPNGENEYCVFFVPNDGLLDGSIVSSTVGVDNVPPTIPGSLTVHTTGTTDIRLHLPEQQSVDAYFSAYLIFYKEGNEGVTTTDNPFIEVNFLDSGFLGATTTRLDGLSAGTQYVANIFAFDTLDGIVRNNITPAEHELVFYTLPHIPNNVAANALSSSEIEIAWEVNENPTGTRYLVFDVNDPDNINSGFVQGTSTIIDGLLAETDYTFQVRAYNPVDGESDVSLDVQAQTLAEDQENNNDNNNAGENGGGGGGAALIIPDLSVSIPLTGGGETARVYTSPEGKTSSANIMIMVQDLEEGLQIALSEDPDFNGISFQMAKEQIPFTLSDGVGQKEIFVRLRNQQGATVELILMIERLAMDDVMPVGGFDQMQEQGIEDAFREEESIQDVVQDTDKEDILQKEEACFLEKQKAYKHEESPAVYMITIDCDKRLFTSPEIYFTHFERWDEVTVVSSEILNAIPDSPLGVMKKGKYHEEENGTLAKKESDNTVYLLLNQERYGIDNADTFVELGFQWNNIQTFASSFIDQYDTAGILTMDSIYPEGTLFSLGEEGVVYEMNNENNRVVVEPIDLDQVENYAVENIPDASELFVQVDINGNPTV